MAIPKIIEKAVSLIGNGFFSIILELSYSRQSGWIDKLNSFSRRILFKGIENW